MTIFSSKNLAGLWLDVGDTREPKYSSSYRAWEELEAKAQIEVDALCYSLKKYRGKDEYFKKLFSGMHKLLKDGIPPRIVESNHLLMERLITSGLELMDLKNEDRQYLHLGAFIDLKIKELWRNLKFYKLVLALLDKIKQQINLLSIPILQKVEEIYLECYPDKYELFATD